MRIFSWTENKINYFINFYCLSSAAVDALAIVASLFHLQSVLLDNISNLSDLILPNVAK